MPKDNEKDLDCEKCGASEDSDNYAEGLGWVCNDCYSSWEDDNLYMSSFNQNWGN